MRRWKVLLLFGLAPVCFAGCEQDETLDASPRMCPNEAPDDGSRCPLAGLVCNFFTGCTDYYPATCQDNLTWSFTDGCEIPDAPGGAGGTGGSAIGGSGVGGDGGGAAGGGGSSTGGGGSGGDAGAGGSAGGGGAGGS